MFRRFRRIIELSKKDPEVLDRYEKLSPEELNAIPNVSKGDGKAEFFGLGSEEEFIEQERADKGLKGWYDRLKRL